MRALPLLLCGLLAACSESSGPVQGNSLPETGAGATVENPYGLQALWHEGPSNPFSPPPDMRDDALYGGGGQRKNETLAYEHNTQRANLRRRIDTELLTINLWVPAAAYQAARSPISDAFSEFGSNVADAAGAVVQFLAYLLPWLVVIVPAIFLLRLFWRSITRWLTRRETRAAAP